jgi:hypothetical protein
MRCLISWGFVPLTFDLDSPSSCHQPFVSAANVKALGDSFLKATPASIVTSDSGIAAKVEERERYEIAKSAAIFRHAG